MKKQMLALSLASTITFGGTFSTALPAGAVGEGPNYNGHESIQTSILHTHESMVDYLKEQDAKQEAMELEVIGQTVQKRDIYAVKYEKNKDNPYVLFLTQQHGNEQLTTEGALEFIKELGTNKLKGVLDNVNILIIPMLNADGAMGDVNFSLDDYAADGERHLTRYNYYRVDLNRDHVKKEQPETQALHNFLKPYEGKIEYAIDLHHQGTEREVNGKYVSGSILYPTTPDVSEDLRNKSKRLGSVVYHAIDPTGWGHIGKYDVGGSANDIGRNGLAAEYGIATLLFEMRGMSDHDDPGRVLGQKSNGYLIKQTIVTLDATVRAIADGSIETADISFWESLPAQNPRTDGEEDE